MQTKIRISFKSEKQAPYLLIVKESFENGIVVWADVIYQENEYKSDIVFEENPIVVNEYRIERLEEE